MPGLEHGMDRVRIALIGEGAGGMVRVPYSDDIGSQRIRNTSLIVRMDNLDLGICPIFPNGMVLGTQSVIRARPPQDGSFPFEYCCIPNPRR